MAEAKPRTYNVNVGVLGHVDSGKTSLVAALSTVLSTAALDKHPQSKERGITLDLGFSSFSVPAPPAVAAAGYERLQFTLVDCPGHASLIRTIIGGAQIIDMMVLVVDITKGIQTQTAECIVLGEVATGDMVVALNKADQLPGDKRERYVSRARKLVAQTLAATRFAGSPMVPTAANPGAGGNGDGAGGAAAAAPLGVVEIVEALVAKARVRPGGGAGPFLFYIDHCFAIKGQGTVLTGTVVKGGIRVNDILELPNHKLQRKVKSMQMFRAPVAACGQGDRVGICVTQVEAKLIERGVAASPGSVPTFGAAVASVERIRFFAGEIRSRSKWHVTVGHATVMAELLFFGEPDQAGGEAALPEQVGACRLEDRSSGGAGASGQAAPFDVGRDYVYQECLYGAEGRPRADQASGSGGGGTDDGGGGLRHYGRQWAYLVFSQPVTAPADALVFGSRLDADLNASSCRLAFHGHICRLVDSNDPAQLRQLRVCKSKSRQGSVERVEADGCTAVCRGMFKKDTDMALFTGMRVTAEADGAEGRIEGAFGKSGKFRVHFPGGAPTEPGARLLLSFRRLLFDKEKKHMLQ